MSKKLFIGLVLLTFLVVGCASQSTPAAEAGDQLKVGDGTTEKLYTVADLEALTASNADFNDVTYKGVALKALLEDAGFNMDEVKAVKAVASDGFSANYDSSIFTRDDVLVSYATADGTLTSDDGVFRMVIPGGEGKQNVRMLAEIQVIK